MEVSRNIDRVNSTASVLNLNNTIVSMRIPMKKAKVHVIHKLTTQIKRYKDKKGDEDQVKANKRKAERLVEEIHIIKKLNNDKALKFAFANIQTLADVASQENLETKAMVRLACHKPIQDRVLKWREEHSDWKSLSAYLLQHITRRLKKKKKKEQKKKEAELHKKDKLFDVKNEKLSSDDSKEKIKKPKNKSQLLEETEDSDRKSDESVNSESESCDNEDSDHGDESKVISSQESNSDSDSEDAEKVSKQKVTLNKANSNSDKNSNPDSKSRDSKQTNKKVKDKLKTELVKEIVKDKMEGELVVKKINLNDLGDEVESLPIEEKDVSFLFQAESETAAAKSKHKTEESDDSDSGNSEDKEHEESATKKKSRDNFFVMDSESEEVSSEDESSSDHMFEEEEDDADDKMEVARRRMMIESTFIGSLNNKKPMGSKGMKKKDKWSNKTANKQFIHPDDKRHGSLHHKGDRGPHPKHSKSFEKSRPHSKDSKQRSQHLSHGRHMGPNTGKRVHSKQSHYAGEPKTQTKPVEDTKLHPSWEASLKRKQEQNSIKSFQGKKIKFDDD